LGLAADDEAAHHILCGTKAEWALIADSVMIRFALVPDAEPAPSTGVQLRPPGCDVAIVRWSLSP